MIGKILWWMRTDRLGPDIPLTHLLLHSRRLGAWLCRKKLRRFGQGSQVRPFSFLVCTGNISLGDNVVVRPGSHLYADPTELGPIIIEDDVLMGPGVHIYTNNHAFKDPSRPISEQGYDDIRPVLLRSGCWIGGNAVILPGVTVGRNAVVGAGAVVTRDVPDFAVAVGVPAKVLPAKNS